MGKLEESEEERGNKEVGKEEVAEDKEGTETDKV